MHSSEFSDELSDLLKRNPTIVPFEGKKFKCLITEHEMPQTISAVRQHVEGKKYQRLTKNIECDFNYTDFEPYIRPATNNSKMLFCTLTLKSINKTPVHVLRHVKGKKFQRARKRYDECQKNGTKFVRTPKLSITHKAAEEESHGQSDEESNKTPEDDLSDLYPEDKIKEEKMEMEGQEKPRKRKEENNFEKKSKRPKINKPNANNESASGGTLLIHP